MISKPSTWADFHKKIQEGGEAIILIPRGQTVPLKAQGDLSLIRLEPGKNEVRFTRDVYIHVSRKGMKISPDKQRWADVGDIEAIKEIFDIGRSELSIGFAASEEEGAFLSIVITTK
jgi:hypothetical protein